MKLTCCKCQQVMTKDIPDDEITDAIISAMVVEHYKTCPAKDQPLNWEDADDRG